MGKSQETFGKKEKEKKRLKKRKEKEEKKEARQAQSKKGKGFEDMIAYVDENGQISSTPPDPRNKTVVNTEDIQIGISRQDPSEIEDPIRKGTITFFNDSKGYGFIKDLSSQESIFVHVNDLSEPVREGDKVSFEVEKGPRGLNAVRVTMTK